jgi:hypothetical protein
MYDTDFLTTQRIVVGVRRRASGVKNDVRHGADGIGVRGGYTASPQARSVVSQVAGESCGVGRER